jgi:hypothetical protein
MAMSEDEKAVQGIKDKKARKEAFYTRQRQNASAGSATQKKIQSKMNLGDEVRSFAKDSMQKIQSSGPWSIPGGRAAEAVEGAVGAGAKALGKGASSLAKRAGGAIEESVQHLRKPTAVKQALGSGKVKLSSSGPHTPKAVAPAKPSAISSGKNHAITSSAKPGAKSGPKAIEGRSPKALGNSGHWQYEKELSKQASKKMPAQPKTFNRNGTPRAEGRQKSTRNPVSKRKSVND